MPAALSRYEHPKPSSPRCSLWYHQIGEAGAAALSKALKCNATLTSLLQVARPALCRRPCLAMSIPGPPSPCCSLKGNQTGDAGAAALSEALKSNATLMMPL